VQQYNTYQQGQASVLKLRTLLETEPSVPEDAGAEELPPIKGEIVFDHVTFGYDPAVPVLHDVNLRIERRRDGRVRRPDREPGSRRWPS
jgi:ATP-binding cassette subfamily B protein